MQETTPKIESFSLRHYLLLTWKWIWLLVFCAVIAAGITFTASRLITPVYQAKTILLVDETPNSGVSDYTAILLSERQVHTYSEMITNRLLLEKVIADLGLTTNVKRLAESIQVVLISDTRLIAVTVEDTDPTRAANIANAIATRFIEQLHTLENSNYEASKASLEKELQQINEQIQSSTAALDALGNDGDTAESTRLKTTLADYRQTYANLVLKYEDVRLAESSANSGIIHLEPAIAPDTPIRPRVLLNTALAAIMGLVLAVCAIFLIEALDDTIRTPEDVSRYLGLPVFGVIPSHPTEMGKPITILQPLSPVSDAFRTLRANIRFASVDRPLKKLLITSSMPGEGKSTLTTNLGVVMAQSDLITIIVDTDFRRPSVHKSLELTNHQGLSNLLAEQQLELNGKVKSTELPNLSVLAAGDLPPNPTELLGSEKMSQILQLLSDRADVLLVDTPPMMVVADAAVIASRVDGVLLAIKPGATRVTVAKQSIEQFRRAKANLLGVILNDVNIKRDGYYGSYYHSYQNRYGEEHRKEHFQAGGLNDENNKILS